MSGDSLNAGAWPFNPSGSGRRSGHAAKSSAMRTYGEQWRHVYPEMRSKLNLQGYDTMIGEDVTSAWENELKSRSLESAPE